ncbi:hypothetical protein [Litorihabitans aurantiacus]|uniref:Uncharacterized protein n=1 Tax=Litorihabitans aurantiacus TaxID=1930061 RepID=A0AA37XI29_9MICO|nr:hypothetical protein [Litorihabitans aurantiacus]GMA33649.1 hypothetical protein GCM10025875_36410 [Litorihabitans aurantiacus]GMA33716.1 hypothetical protein GCM10025875_37080 [Litorihabitans aurantiacus]GMA33780.1 hypothetical protein GCM10025875_37720 [Litorihabitans aurantiacus]
MTTTCSYKFTGSNLITDPLPIRDIDNFKLAGASLQNQGLGFTLAGSKAGIFDSQTRSQQATAQVYNWITIPPLSPQGTIVFQLSPTGAVG